MADGAAGAVSRIQLTERIHRFCQQDEWICVVEPCFEADVLLNDSQGELPRGVL